MATVFLNGAFISQGQARVSAFDAAFQHGVGLFETMLAVRGGERGARVVHLHEHIERLATSSMQLRLTESLRKGALAEAVERTAERAAADHPDTPRWRIRLTITGGDMNLLAASRGETDPQSVHQPTLLIVAQPATQYPAEMFERGVAVTVSDWRANPLDTFQGHKTVNYWPRLSALQAAAGKRAAEALVFQVTNYLAGGCVSNAFVVRNGTLITPIARGEEDEAAQEADAGRSDPSQQPVNHYDPPAKGAVAPAPVLPGIVRRWVLDWALAKGITTQRRMVSIADVLDADEVFLTNSSWGVLPVVAVEAKPIAQRRVGDTTREFIAAWSELIAG